MFEKFKPKCDRHKIQSEEFEHGLLVAFIQTSLVAQVVLKLLLNSDLVLTLGCEWRKVQCWLQCSTTRRLGQLMLKRPKLLILFQQSVLRGKVRRSPRVCDHSCEFSDWLMVRGNRVLSLVLTLPILTLNRSEDSWSSSS